MNITIPRETFDAMREALEQSLRGMSAAIFGTDTYKVSSRGDFASKVEKQILEALTAAKAVSEADKDARTWCVYVAGMIGCYLNEPVDSDKCKAIAGIIERRLWALPSASVSHQKPETTQPTEGGAITVENGKAVTSECSKVTSEYSEQPQAQEARVIECARRLVEHADFQLGGILSADSKAKDIPSKAVSQVKSRHLAALRDALPPAPKEEAQ